MVLFHPNFTNEKLRHRSVTEPARDFKLMSCGALIFCHIPNPTAFTTGLRCLLVGFLLPIHFVWVVGDSRGVGGIDYPKGKLLTKSIVIIAAHVTPFETSNSIRMNECKLFTDTAKANGWTACDFETFALDWGLDLSESVHDIPTRFSRSTRHCPRAHQKAVWPETQLNRGCFQEPGVGVPQVCSWDGHIYQSDPFPQLQPLIAGTFPPCGNHHLSDHVEKAGFHLAKAV